MTTRGELSAAVRQSYVHGCGCGQYKRLRDCTHTLSRHNRIERDIVLLALLLDLRDLLAEATLVRTLVADMLRDEGWRSPPLSDEEIERRMAKRRAERAGAK